MSMIQSIFKKFRFNPRTDPARDWLFLVGIMILLFIGLIVWNAWAFDTVASGKNIGGVVPQSVPIFDETTLETVHTIFETRATEEAKYVTGVYRYTDPSH